MRLVERNHAGVPSVTVKYRKHAMTNLIVITVGKELKYRLSTFIRCGKMTRTGILTPGIVLTAHVFHITRSMLP